MLFRSVYYTQAEWQMTPTMWTINDASMTFTLKGENTKKIMILGDLMNGNAMLNMYSKETLSDSDIVQVAHHALYGPDFPLYETIDPEFTFWPIAPPGYAKYAHVIPRNNKLRRMGIPHYMAAFGEVTVTL